MSILQKIKDFKLKLTSRTTTILLSFYFGYFLNMALIRFLFERIKIDSVGSFLFLLSLLLFIFVIYFVIFSVVLITKYSKILIAIFLLISAQINYLMFKLGVYIDADMVRNLFETNRQEVFDLITFSNFLWLLITGIIPTIIFTKYIKIEFKPLVNEVIDRIYSIAGTLVIVFLFGLANYKSYVSFIRSNREGRKLVNTLNYIYSLSKYLKSEYTDDQPFAIIDDSVKYVGKNQHKTLLIFVLGETARSANFSLGGYEKNKTNPLLSKQNIVYYDAVKSCGTATATSLPCMFSHLNRTNFNIKKAKNSENVLDLLSKAGYNVSWIGNYGTGCKSICDRIKHETVKKDSTLCKGEYCRDEILLNSLNSKIQNLQDNSVIVLHTIGSHGPTYHERYSDRFKTFKPTCDTADIRKCGRESIVNTYDNTILYTDWFLSSIIDTVKKINDISVALIYVSDHGESLGESNLYLHGLPYVIAPKYQTEVPMIVYMNELMKQEHNISYDCLKGSSKKKNFSHDNIFHSLLGLLEVESKIYNENLDIFKKCIVKK